MGGVENHLRAEFLHPGNRAHVGDQVVVAEGRSALGEEIVPATGPHEFGGDIFHIPRSEELAFFDIHHPAGFGCCHDEIGLTAEERGDLEDIDKLGSDLGFFGRVDIGGDRGLDGSSDFGQEGTTIANRSAAERFHRGAIGFVVGGFENKSRSLAITDFFDPGRHPASEGRRLDDAGA